MIDYGGLFLMNQGLFVCGTQGNKQHDAPIFSATYGETPWHITAIHIPYKSLLGNKLKSLLLLSLTSCLQNPVFLFYLMEGNN